VNGRLQPTLLWTSSLTMGHRNKLSGLPYLLITCVLVFSFGEAFAKPNNKGDGASIIYWSDGDSGLIDGVKFRLANVDAPETGSLKQQGGAKCELEREKGYDAKAFIVALTKSGKVKIVRDYGYDRYQRLVVDLSVDGVDVGERAIADGILKAWPHRSGRTLSAKPDWCQND